MRDGARELARRSPHLSHADNCSRHVDSIKVMQLAGNELQHLLHIRQVSGRAGESMGGMHAWRAWDACMHAYMHTTEGSASCASEQQRPRASKAFDNDRPLCLYISSEVDTQNE